MRTVRSDMVVYWWRGEWRWAARRTDYRQVVSAERHRVARRLRHVAGSIVKELHPSDHVVIRAPGEGGMSHRLGWSSNCDAACGGLSNWQVVIGESV
ncbi:hypothetical protein ABLN97_07690 [Mycobacterium tuberculosis]